jgi:hypothetical protein
MTHWQRRAILGGSNGAAADETISNIRSYMLAAMLAHDDRQRIVLGALLDAHPRLLGVDELDARLRVPRVHEALRMLVDDGLATRLGDRVGVSRAAVRAEQLLRSKA